MLSKRDATRGGIFFSALLKLKSWNIACVFYRPRPIAENFTRFLVNFAYIKTLISFIVVHHEIQYIPASGVDPAV